MSKSQDKSEQEKVAELRERHGITSAAARQVLSGKKIAGVSDDEWFEQKPKGGQSKGGD